MKIARIFAAIAAMVTPANLSAAEIQYHDHENGGYVTLIGEIEEGDAESVEKIFTAKEVTTVFLQSIGGNLSEAIKIGRIININNARTVVINDSVCSSSCALVWLAGSPRIAQPRAKIGFHAGYVLENNKAVPSGIGNAIVGRYLTQLGLSEKAVMYATAAGPDEMLWVDTTAPGSEGFTYELIEDEEKNDVATPSVNSSTRATARVTDKSLHGKTFGAWTVYAADDASAAITRSTNQKGSLGYICRPGRNCQYAVKFDMTCNPGETYEIDYQVDGYQRKPTQLTCDMDGDLLYLADFNGFTNDIAGEIGVTIIAADGDKKENRYRYSIIGLVEAVEAMTDAGYLVTSKR